MKKVVIASNARDIEKAESDNYRREFFEKRGVITELMRMHYDKQAFNELFAPIRDEENSYCYCAQGITLRAVGFAPDYNWGTPQVYREASDIMQCALNGDTISTFFMPGIDIMVLATDEEKAAMLEIEKLYTDRERRWGISGAYWEGGDRLIPENALAIERMDGAVIQYYPHTAGVRTYYSPTEIPLSTFNDTLQWGFLKIADIIDRAWPIMEARA